MTPQCWRGDAVGRPSWESSFLGDPDAKFLCGKRGAGTKQKETAKERDKENSVREEKTCSQETQDLCNNGGTHDE